MTVKGIDIAWARPSIADIKATGAHWVARYFSTDSSKNITKSEVTDYTSAGLGVVVVWETTAGRATAGRTAGVADAKAAEVQRAAVGLPASMPIHFAVDEDTSWASVEPYFAGVASVIGLDRVGCYGSFRVVNGAYNYGIRYLWQTVAWSAGNWSGYATIRQPGGTVLSGSADIDYAYQADFGQYPRPEEDPMAAFTAQDIHDAVWKIDDIKAPFTETDPKNGTWQPQSYLKAIYEMAAKASAKEAAQDAALAALVKAVTTLASNTAALDPAALIAEIKAEIAKVTITLNPGS